MLENYNIQVLKKSGLYALSSIVKWQYIDYAMTKYHTVTIIKPLGIIDKIINSSSKIFFNLGKLTTNIWTIIYATCINPLIQKCLFYPFKYFSSLFNNNLFQNIFNISLKYSILYFFILYFLDYLRHSPNFVYFYLLLGLLYFPFYIGFFIFIL